MTLLFIACIFIIIVYLWIKKRYSYWSSRGVEGPEPFPIVGNYATVMAAKEHNDMLYERIYNDYCNKPYVGIYQLFRPVLLVRDPEMIKHILINKFSVFQNRGIKGAYPHNDNAFSADGEPWRVLRSIMSQTFTPGKLKSRMPLLEQCANEYLKYVDDSLERSCDYEMQYDLMWRYGLHVNGVYLFGLDLKALSNDKNEFKYMLDEFFNPGLYSRIIQYVDQIIPGFQKVASTLKIDPRVIDISKVLAPVVYDVIKGRHGQLAELNNYTNQLVEIVKKQNVLEKQDNRIEFERSDMVLLTQVLLTYLGQVDTGSAFMSMFMKEVAFDQEVQNRLLKEILEVTKNENGNITYDSLNDMVYMEMVLNEVLRMYANGFIQRQAVSDYEFPGTKLKIEKGTIIIVPPKGLHMDPNYFEDPEVFNPERFSPQNMKNIPDCTFLPFGAGPRHCVGMTSIKLQLKYGIAAFLRRFKVEPCKRSTKQLQFYATALALTKSKGIWLKVSKRNSD